MFNQKILALCFFLCCYTKTFAIQFWVTPNVYQVGINFTAKCSIETVLQAMEHKVHFQHNGRTIGTYSRVINSPTVTWIPVPNTDGVMVEPVERQSPYSVNIKPLNSAAEGLYRCQVWTIEGTGNDFTTTTYNSFNWNTSGSSTAVLSFSTLVLIIFLYSQFTY